MSNFSSIPTFSPIQGKNNPQIVGLKKTNLSPTKISLPTKPLIFLLHYFPSSFSIPKSPQPNGLNNLIINLMDQKFILFQIE